MTLPPSEITTVQGEGRPRSSCSGFSSLRSVFLAHSSGQEGRGLACWHRPLGARVSCGGAVFRSPACVLTAGLLWALSVTGVTWRPPRSISSPQSSTSLTLCPAHSPHLRLWPLPRSISFWCLFLAEPHAVWDPSSLTSDQTGEAWSPTHWAASTCALSRFSRIRLRVTPRSVTRQAPLSVGFSRQESCSGLLCAPPGHLPNPGIKPVSLVAPALAGRFFTTSAA